MYAHSWQIRPVDPATRISSKSRTAEISGMVANRYLMMLLNGSSLLGSALRTDGGPEARLRGLVAGGDLVGYSPPISAKLPCDGRLGEALVQMMKQ
jgi:hypothetical protein